MKKILKTALVLLLLFVCSDTFPKAGPAIPIPKISISEAIETAKEYFYKKETRVRDSNYFKIKDYIIISVRYTAYFNGKREKEWAWEIKFVHPVQNDHSAVYKVTNNRQIIFVGGSE